MVEPSQTFSRFRTKGTMAHEIMHALGFYHEHMRPDRDDYVTINENNIKAAMIHNFKKGKYKTYDFYDFNRYYIVALVK